MRIFANFCLIILIHSTTANLDICGCKGEINILKTIQQKNEDRISKLEKLLEQKDENESGKSCKTNVQDKEMSCKLDGHSTLENPDVEKQGRWIIDFLNYLEPKLIPAKIKAFAEENGLSWDIDENINKRFSGFLYERFSYDNITLLHVAAKTGDKNMLSILLSIDGIEVNIRDRWNLTPLHDATRFGHAEAVFYLLTDERIEVNPKDYIGRTPLYYAVRFLAPEFVLCLLSDKRIDVMAVKENGWTALNNAIQYNKMDVVPLLLSDPRIDVNSKDNSDCTPLYWAVRFGYGNMTSLLLTDDRVEVNPLDNEGETPLFAAAYWGQTETAEVLMRDPRVDIDVRNNEGKTAFDVAKERENYEILNILKSRRPADDLTVF